MLTHAGWTALAASMLIMLLSCSDGPDVCSSGQGPGSQRGKTSFKAGVSNPLTAVIDRQGDLWFGNVSKNPNTKLVRISMDAQSVEAIDAIDSGVTSPVSAVVDPEGRVWFGTTGGSSEIIRISIDPNSRQAELSRFATPVTNPAWPIVDQNGSIWFGSFDESTRLVVRISGDLDATPTITAFDTGSLNPVTAVMDLAGSLWFGNFVGVGSSAVVRVSGDLAGEPTFTLVDTGVSKPSFPILDSSGQIWIGNDSDSTFSGSNWRKSSGHSQCGPVRHRDSECSQRDRRTR